MCVCVCVLGVGGLLTVGGCVCVCVCVSGVGGLLTVGPVCMCMGGVGSLLTVGPGNSKMIGGHVCVCVCVCVYGWSWGLVDCWTSLSDQVDRPGHVVLLRKIL